MLGQDLLGVAIEGSVLASNARCRNPAAQHAAKSAAAAGVLVGVQVDVAVFGRGPQPWLGVIPADLVRLAGIDHQADRFGRDQGAMRLPCRVYV